jgi:putative ABC transport system ATP-binding protein
VSEEPGCALRSVPWRDANARRYRPLVDAAALHRGKSLSVRAEGVEVRFTVGSKVVKALDAVDLEVPAGQFVVVRGRSGSGKTTLLHVIAGLQRPDAGRVVVGDVELQTLSATAADRFRRRHVGLMFQFFNLIPSLTVEMNVALPLLLEGQRLRHLHEPIEALASALGIGHRLHHAPHELSGGEMQRVAIARALIVNPQIILADEPTGNLDSRTAHEVFLLLREQVDRRGVTTLVMTHDPDLTNYADRVVEIRDGRLLSDTTIKGGGG